MTVERSDPSLEEASNRADEFLLSAPSVSLPKGGGAIRGIGEKFSVNAITGTSSMSVPITASPGRSGFGPGPVLHYDSGNGNGVFGLGWNLDVSSISRKTDRGLPQYHDDVESDTFLLRGVEDLLPLLDADSERPAGMPTRLGGVDYTVYRYLPRVEGSFLLIERWVQVDRPEKVSWRTISADNVTTWYGRTENSRVYDLDHPWRIYEWLITTTHDDKGNVISYIYEAENGDNVPSQTWESNRLRQMLGTNRYLKRIRYGNRTPYFPTLDADAPETPLPTAWLFELVFDYGDHTGMFPSPVPDRRWPARLDAFSNHRPGFEVRTYRRCERALMFHHFPEQQGVGRDCLVRSTTFSYGDLSAGQEDPASPGYSMLMEVEHWSYAKDQNGAYHRRMMPPLSFQYSEARIADTVPLPAEDLPNLPIGIMGNGYRWVDLDGEGLCGVLADQGGAWYYQANRGNAEFGPIRVQSARPALASLAPARQQLIDLAGDGLLDLVDFGAPTPGYHGREHNTWSDFVPFKLLPIINWDAGNQRLIDLTGDGHADLLVTEDEVFTWYPSLGRAGFAEAEWTRQVGDEDESPRVVFNDGTQTMFLADMCGDGLTDLVRIRNGEICYWPNLGYGRFGRKVMFGNAPRFDQPDLFDPRRVRLADVDGSGPTDIIYLGRRGAQLYLNRSGNVLADVVELDAPTATENLDSVQVVDLMGNGTACIVWSSHLPDDAGHPLRYIELMAEGAAGNDTRKPHLLTDVKNNMGGRIRVEYAPSTHFYLQDTLAGRPWATQLPFPVQCVSKVTTRDMWRQTTFTSTYTYHHGHFDGSEREFRGFGRVEQTDVEDFGTFAAGNAASPFITQDLTLYQPPTRTVTWYQTGVAAEHGRLLGHLTHEYFPGQRTTTGPFHERALAEPQLDTHLPTWEWREALRACKGMVLRREIYELDAKDLAASPTRHTPVRLLSVVQHNCRVRRLQPMGPNRHAVFHPIPDESVEYQHDLPLPRMGGMLRPDPRVTHTLHLRHDEYGKPQQTVTVAYGRLEPAPPSGLPADSGRDGLIASVQSADHVSYAETRYTQDVLKTGAGTLPPVKHRRLRVPCEVRTYELTGLTRPVSGYFNGEFLLRHELCEDERYPAEVPEGQQPIPVRSLPYHRQVGDAGPHRRLVQQTRTLFFDDGDGVITPSQPLPFGQHGPRGLKYEDYRLALTEDLVEEVLARRDASGQRVEAMLDWSIGPGRAARSLLDNPSVSGFVRGTSLDNSLTGQYWLRSGTASYAVDARQTYYLPHRYTDAFGAATQITYDPLFLHVTSRIDPVGNAVAVDEFDYRVLAPRAINDANANRDEIAFDILGLVVAVAHMGKQVNGRWQGDDLTGFDFMLANPPTKAVVAFCMSNRLDSARARQWLAGASARFVYHFGDSRDPQGAVQWATRMAGTCAIAREQHVGRLPQGQVSPLNVMLECSDGFGRMLMKKVQAEPDPVRRIADPAVPLRWIVNGLEVANNKGKVVKRYQPAFSDDFGFELPQANGLAEVLYYDAEGRCVRTEFPDGTLSRVEYSPWHVTTFDQNDTVLESAWYQTRRQHSPAASLPTDVAGIIQATPDQRAGWLTARHAGTPAISVLDSLGREVIDLAHNRIEHPDGSIRFDGRTWRDDISFTYTKLDAEGKPLWVRDTNGNLVMQYITPVKPTRRGDPANGLDPEAMPINSAPCYDIAGNLLFQHAMDAGPRWMLNDAAGHPMLQWDINHRMTDAGATSTERRLLMTRYDLLHRMVEQRLVINGGPPALVEVVVHRDGAGLDPVELARSQQLNLIGQAVEHWDASGCTIVRRADFNGAVEWMTRMLVRDHRAAVVDWDLADRLSALSADVFHQITERDALGRTTTLFNWHRGDGSRVAVYESRYNERGALVAEELTIGARKTASDSGRSGGIRTRVIREIRYNEKGQRTSIELGNGTTTRYEYDPVTNRLLHVYTRRDPAVPGDCKGDPAAVRPSRPCGVQNLHYSYDPVGNITHVQDDAQDTIWFDNQQVEPSNDFTYDALYRLTEATGREHDVGTAPPIHPEGSWPTGEFPSPDTLRRYAQCFEYDRAGNLTALRHVAKGGSWTRNFSYSYQDAAQPASNRLERAWSGTASWDATTPANRTQYRHDDHGSMLTLMSPAGDVRWDWRDSLRSLDLQGGGSAFYNYDSSRQRTRKRIERLGGDVEERIYLDGFEWYRRWVGGAVVEEIESHHLSDATGRILLVDEVILVRPGSQPRPNGVRTKPQTLFRYQYANHIGSVGIELDATARLISYEEFHPYGTTAYRLLDSATEVPAKRYRYTGMERDEESGLAYHGSRYLSSTLVRWVSADPTGIAGGTNVFSYAAGNPVSMLDRSGRQPVQSVQLPGASVRGKARMTMEEAAAAIRDTWSWEDQEVAQEARHFYHEQFRAAYREKANEGMKLVFVLWAAMGIIVVGGVAGGLAEGAIVGAAGGPEAAGLGVKLLASGLGGSLGASVEVSLEQGLRAIVGERLLTPVEGATRVGLGAGVGVVVRAAGALLAKGVETLRQVRGLGNELGEAAAEGLLEGAREVVRGGAASGFRGIPQLTNEQLAARAEALFMAFAKARLEASGRVVTQEAIDSLRWNTVAVLQGTKNGQTITLAAINQSSSLQLFAGVVTETGDVLIEPVAFITIGPRGGFKLGHEHAEAVLYAAAKELGLESPRVASSIPGCWDCQWGAIEAGVEHVNPKPIDKLRLDK
jgi:RHS repeat-associated protein